MPAILAARMISSPPWWVHRDRKVFRENRARRVRLVPPVRKAHRENKARKVRLVPPVRKDL